MDKRTFIKQATLISATALPAFSSLSNIVSNFSHLEPLELASDEDFWKDIRKGYKLKKEYVNLENGYYCMLPEETLENYIAHVREVNLNASFYMRTVQAENKNKARQELADLAGCSYDELIITRNTTESLDLVIGGMHWEKGDEAIMAEQDYGAMLNMFRLMGERYGVVSKKISLSNKPNNDEEIVELYESKITEKTKLLMLCHMVNINGQVLPIKKICDMAHKHGVEVMVDGAHAFAHLDFKISELNCDYYGTSLHKWLSVPLGAGFLYVKEDKIKNLWPLFAENERPIDDIDRIGHTGTTPVHVELAISDAIAYHKVIGGERKEARLRYLKDYWTKAVKDNPKIMINSPLEEGRGCGIENVIVKGYTSSEMAKELLEKYQVWTVAIKRPNVHGCRITPNVYTSTEELDIFISALKSMAG